MNVGAKIRAARSDAGLSQTELGGRIGVTQSVISDWENDRLQSWRDYAPELATALGKPRGFFADEVQAATRADPIPVAGDIEANAFRARLEITPIPSMLIPVVRLGGYGVVEQRARLVVGPGADHLYPDGTYVIVISAGDTDIFAGDRVVVRRREGNLEELSIREVRHEADGRIQLWPRSSDPAHQAPLPYRPGEADCPEILEVIIGSYRPEHRPTVPLVRRKPPNT